MTEHAPRLAGNVPDPDAAVLDSLIETADPPEPNELPRAEEEVAPGLWVARSLPSRMLTVTLAIQNTWEPQLLLPADDRRISLQLWAASDTATDFARIADDSGKVQTDGASVPLYSGMLLALPTAHTGPVWAYAPTATGPITVSVLAVTR